MAVVRLVFGVTIFLIGMALFWPTVASVVVALNSGVSAAPGERGLMVSAWIGFALSLVWIAGCAYAFMALT